MAETIAPDPSAIVVFVDGVGLRRAEAGNPFSDVPMPALEGALGRRLVLGESSSMDGVVVREVDANLGVEGLPQSATGQTTIFTGRNAARYMGRHVAAFPGPRLCGLIDGHGLLARVAAAGEVAFANAFAPTYEAEIEARRRRASVTVRLAWSAGLVLRGLEDLVRDEALSWDIERDFLSRAFAAAGGPIPGREAGRHLARLGARYRLTVFETFLPDLAGHRRAELEPRDVVRRLDALFEGLFSHRAPETTVVLVSDHGNFEEPEHRRHTRNPVPLAAVGPGAAHFAGASSLVDVTPGVLETLGVPA